MAVWVFERSARGAATAGQPGYREYSKKLVAHVAVRIGLATSETRCALPGVPRALLDHGAVRINGLSLGLVGPEGTEPEISITDLETRLATCTDVLCAWLSADERCNRTATALAGLLARQPEGVELARLRVACGHDDATLARVRPFWGLIRTDLRGLPVVLLPGSQYVSQTSTRRNTGAQYTTKALAEEIVQYALEPLVYDPGPQTEADPANWKLRTPSAILDLRVCDPAVGSGAILTARGALSS